MRRQTCGRAKGRVFQAPSFIGGNFLALRVVVEGHAVRSFLRRDSGGVIFKFGFGKRFNLELCRRRFSLKAVVGMFRCKVFKLSPYRRRKVRCVLIGVELKLILTATARALHLSARCFRQEDKLIVKDVFQISERFTHKITNDEVRLVAVGFEDVSRIVLVPFYVYRGVGVEPVKIERATVGYRLLRIGKAFLISLIGVPTLLP